MTRHWYDTFQFQNTKWLWLVNDVVTTLNSDNVLCGTFGLYPSYVAGILNYVKEINYYVLSNKRVSYCNHSQLYCKKCALLSYLQKTISANIWLWQFCYHFHARLIHGKLLPRLILAQSVLRKMRLSSLAYDFACIKKVEHISQMTC
jgi:hypothetical protein